MVIINKKTNGTHPITQWDLVRIPLSYRDGVPLVYKLISIYLL